MLPSALIAHDSSLVEKDEVEAHRRSIRCKIKRIHKIRELHNEEKVKFQSIKKFE